jgi:hypothetical protein
LAFVEKIGIFKNMLSIGALTSGTGSGGIFPYLSSCCFPWALCLLAAARKTARKLK